MKKRLIINNVSKVLWELGVAKTGCVAITEEHYKLFWKRDDDSESWCLEIGRTIYLEPWENTDQCTITLIHYNECFQSVRLSRSWIMPISALDIPKWLVECISKMLLDETHTPTFHTIRTTIVNGPFQPRQGIATRYSSAAVNKAFYGTINVSHSFSI